MINEIKEILKQFNYRKFAKAYINCICTINTDEMNIINFRLKKTNYHYGILVSIGVEFKREYYFNKNLSIKENNIKKLNDRIEKLSYLSFNSNELKELRRLKEYRKVLYNDRCEFNRKLNKLTDKYYNLACMNEPAYEKYVGLTKDQIKKILRLKYDYVYPLLSSEFKNTADLNNSIRLLEIKVNTDKKKIELEIEKCKKLIEKQEEYCLKAIGKGFVSEHKYIEYLYVTRRKTDEELCKLYGRDMVSIALKEIRRRKIRRHRNETYEKLTGYMDKNKYSNYYLKTYHWEITRSDILKRDDYKCVKCGKKNNLQVHHLTYERRGCEDINDLVTLCNSCHEKEHNIQKQTC